MLDFMSLGGIETGKEAGIRANAIKDWMWQLVEESEEGGTITIFNFTF